MLVASTQKTIQNDATPTATVTKPIQNSRISAASTHKAIKTIAAQAVAYERQSTYKGLLHPNILATVNAPVDGQVIKFHSQFGQYIEKGEKNPQPRFLRL